MYICSAKMGFTVEDRYLPLPALTTMKVLHLAKKEIHRLTAAHCASYNICLTSVNRIIKYELQLNCMLVCCKRPLPAWSPFYSTSVISFPLSN